MYSAQELEAMPKQFERYMLDLEKRVMEDVVERIKRNEEVTSVADWNMLRISELRGFEKDLKKYIKEALGYSSAEVDKLFNETMGKGYVRDKELYSVVGKTMIAFKDNKELQQVISSVIEQTNNEIRNITQTTAFAVKTGDKIQITPLSEYFAGILDGAMMDVMSGTFDYNKTIVRVVDEMTRSGLRTVNYASGYSCRVDVAARRAVMTGISQISGKISEQNAAALGTKYFEVSWHGGSRPSHQPWQGRVFTMQELIDVCGYGTAEGLKGPNCRHDFEPFILGDKRTYTDEQLEEMNAHENEKKEFNGKEYNAYEASQYMRALERDMRAQREKIHLLEVAGVDDKQITLAKCKYRAKSQTYTAFAEKMGLPQERARVYGDGLGRGGKTTRTVAEKVNDVKESIENAVEDGIIKVDKMSDISTGGRRNELPLSNEQIERAKNAARKQGYDGEILYSNNSNTAFHGSLEGEKFHYMVIGTDAYPGEVHGGSANERVTLNGCMAHEVVGHYETWKKGTVQSVEALEEAQASIRAAKFGIDLTDEERNILYEDGIDRLKNAGISFSDVANLLDIWER